MLTIQGFHVVFNEYVYSDIEINNVELQEHSFSYSVLRRVGATVKPRSKEFRYILWDVQIEDVADSRVDGKR